MFASDSQTLLFRNKNDLHITSRSTWCTKPLSRSSCGVRLLGLHKRSHIGKCIFSKFTPYMCMDSPIWVPTNAVMLKDELYRKFCFGINSDLER